MNIDNFEFTPEANACYPKPIAPPVKLPAKDSVPNASANSLYQKDKHHYTLKGKVILESPKGVVKADKIKVNRQEETAQATGKVQFFTSDFTVLGKSLNLNQKNSRAIIQSPTYQISQSRAHGTASQLDTNREYLQSFLKDATFSTCKLDNPSLYEPYSQQHDLSKKNVNWMLGVDLLEIDDAKQMVYCNDATLYFYSIPVLYTPYIQFSTAKRKTGVLIPSFGGIKSITQKTNENYLSVPIYFNLDPQYDDTLTLTKMQDRGVLFSNEFRYLQKTHSATFNSHFIEDAVAKRDTNVNGLDIDPISQRWDMHLTAKQKWGQGITSNVNWRRISDRYIYADLPIDSTLDTKTYLERNAKIQYRDDQLNASINVLDYLRLQDNTKLNYTKKPEVTLNFNHNFAHEYLQNFRFNLLAEATEFEISEAIHSKPEALRTVFSPSFQYNVIKPYGHFKTEIIGNQVHYEMQDNGFNNTGAVKHDITLPQFVLGGGLVFERDFELNNRTYVQTLEPQVQYLYTPFQNQSHITRFDTSKSSLDFSNLFAYNRFSSFDRIGDTNQISVALSSKILSHEGKNLAEIGLGQIFFLSDQKTQLTGNEINTDRVSDYFLKLSANANRFSLNATAQFSKENYELSNANSRLKLDLSPEFIFLLTDTVKNYNQAGEKEELSAGFNWKMNDKWALGSYINYDFTDERKKEHSGAIRFDNCCWSSELSVKETKLDNGLYNYTFQYFIELKGFSSTGEPFQQYLTNELNF